jgi:hypothetical protein
VLGDVSDDHRISVAIQTDDQGVNFGSEMRNHSLELSDGSIARMRAIGVFDLSDLIVKTTRTEFEDVILRAVHWLASAQMQPENENALLNLVTCLETFFKAEAGTPITATIAEGVALGEEQAESCRESGSREDTAYVELLEIVRTADPSCGERLLCPFGDRLQTGEKERERLLPRLGHVLVSVEAGLVDC